MIVLCFSIPHGKHDVYILPSMPMFYLALAPLIPGLLRRRDIQRVLGGFTLLLALVTLGAGASALLGTPGFEARLVLERGLEPGAMDAMAWAALAMGGAGVAGLLLFGPARRHLALVSMLTVAWVLYSLVGYPVLNDSSSARGLMQSVDARLGAAAELGLVAWKEQNLLMAGRPAATFGFNVPWHEQLQAGVQWQQLSPPRRWLLAHEDALLGCVDRGGAVLAGVANRRRWWLVPASAVHGPCVPSEAELKRERRLQRNEQ